MCIRDRAGAARYLDTTEFNVSIILYFHRYNFRTDSLDKAADRLLVETNNEVIAAGCNSGDTEIAIGCKLNEMVFPSCDPLLKMGIESPRELQRSSGSKAQWVKTQLGESIYKRW